MANPHILIANRKLINPLDLQPEDIDLDVAIHALSRLPRYSGQTPRTYRVAEHVVKLAGVVPNHLRRAALLHDCSEGFGLLDFAHPIKLQMPAYRDIEDAMLKVIFARFDVPWEHMAELAPYDRRMCQDEMTQLFSPPYDIGLEPLGVTIQCWGERKCEVMLRRAFVAEGLL
ncbi:phosphohydrolase [Mesorhizobium sp. M0843]|uniref:phosphohydrolase n=1 Tax=Mesorhizobium sp. M0843 TaxID=2957010 RepID=UPI003339BB1D